MNPVLTAADPVGGGAAQKAARTELSRPEYRHDGPSIVDRVTHWIGRQLDKLTGSSGAGHAVLLLAVVAIVVVIALAARAGRLPSRRRTGTTDDTFDPLAGTDAREHRRLAGRYEVDGKHAEALREWLRAAVATIEERGILPVRPGRTGARTAAEAGPVLPGAAADLAASTGAFDQVWFGGRAATAEDVAAAHRAADAVRSERPRTQGGADTPAGIAAPL